MNLLITDAYGIVRFRLKCPVCKNYIILSAPAKGGIGHRLCLNKKDENWTMNAEVIVEGGEFR